MKKKTFKKYFLLTLLALLVFDVLWFGYTGFVLEKKLPYEIQALCREQDSFRLGDVTDFDWDYAYLAVSALSYGDEPKTKMPIRSWSNPITVHFGFSSDEQFIKFVKGDYVTRIMYLDTYFVYFSVATDLKIMPDSVLEVKWHYPDRADGLILSLKSE